MATVIQFKRGTTANLYRVNPYLAKGEPCFDYEQGKLKIGDGIHNYNDLPFITDGIENTDEVIYADSLEELPSVGDKTLIYKVGSNPSLYQWNSTTLKYETLGGSGFNADEIFIINGGKANE